MGSPIAYVHFLVVPERGHRLHFSGVVQAARLLYGSVSSFSNSGIEKLSRKASDETVVLCPYAMKMVSWLCSINPLSL